MRNSNVRYVAIGGLCAAISVIMVFVASVIPTSKIAIMFCSGLCCLVLLEKHKFWHALSSHIAAGVISLMIVANPVYGLSFLTMFGLYPLVRYQVKKYILNVKKQLIILFFCSLAVILGAYFITIFVFYSELQVQSWVILMVVPGAALVVFVEETICNWFSKVITKIKI